jgi:hypothetical protein
MRDLRQRLAATPVEKALLTAELFWCANVADSFLDPDEHMVESKSANELGNLTSYRLHHSVDRRLRLTAGIVLQRLLASRRAKKTGTVR